MKQINDQMLNEFSERQNIDFVSVSINDAIGVISSAFLDVSEKNRTLLSPDKFDISLISSFAFGTNTQSSEVDLLLTIESASMELNSQTLVQTKWGIFKTKLKEAWKNLRKKKKKKKKKNGSDFDDQTYLSDYSYTLPYNIKRFKNDLFDAMTKYLSPTTLIYNNSNGLRILGRDEFGVPINIKIGIKSGDTTKFFNENNNGFDEYSFKVLKERIEEKQGKIGENFSKVYRILENLYFAENHTEPDPFLIGTILLGIEDKLFLGKEIAKVFKVILNYISNITIHTFLNETNTEEIVMTKSRRLLLKTRSNYFLKDVMNLIK